MPIGNFPASGMPNMSNSCNHEWGSFNMNFAIAPGCSPFSLSSRRFGGLVGHRVGFDTAQQMMTLLKQAFDDLARRVVGIGDKVERRLDAHGLE